MVTPAGGRWREGVREEAGRKDRVAGVAASGVRRGMGCNRSRLRILGIQSRVAPVRPGRYTTANPNATVGRLEERRTGGLFELDGRNDAWVIGRAGSADVHIADSRVSRRHARISGGEGGWFLEDLGSANGTWLNGAHVGRRVALRPGDAIALGSTVLVFLLPEGSGDGALSSDSTAALPALRSSDPALEAELERHRRDRELELARELQVGLLQRSMPETPGYSLHAGCVPSLLVSGDYYRVLLRRGGRELLVMVVDAAGKGMSGALLTVSVEALAAAPIESGLEPQQVLEVVGRLLHARTGDAHFATAILLTVDLESGRLRCANAGHLPGLLVRRDGTVQELDSTGLSLGVFPDSGYGSLLAVLERGDTIVLYTDGLTEVEDPECEQWGRERLADLCSAFRELPPAELAGTVESEVVSFSGGTLLADDRTLVVVRRDGGD